MRLSFVCLFKKTVPGNIFRGKNRLVKPVTYSAMEHLRQEFDRQDKVMELLRYPYLTREESSGHAQELQKKMKWVKKWKDYQQSSGMKKNVTIEERLHHLTIKDAWE